MDTSSKKLMAGGVIALVVVIVLIYYYSKGSMSASAPVPLNFSVGESSLVGQQMMSCPAGQKINVVSAQYGSKTNPACPNPDVSGVLGGLANGQNSFTLGKSGNNVFGDKCPGVLKDLWGTYTCM